MLVLDGKTVFVFLCGQLLSVSICMKLEFFFKKIIYLSFSDLICKTLKSGLILETGLWSCGPPVFLCYAKVILLLVVVQFLCTYLLLL